MQTTTLTFTKVAGVYQCKLPDYTANTGGVIQISLVGDGSVSVSANVPSMQPSVIATIETEPYTDSVIFELSLPYDLEVTLNTSVAVKSAVWMK